MPARDIPYIDRAGLVSSDTSNYLLTICAEGHRRLTHVAWLNKGRLQAVLCHVPEIRIPAVLVAKC